MIDEKTAHLKLPLPHADNLLEDDVERLRAALAGVDAKSEEVDGIVATLDTTLKTVRQSAAEAAGKAAWAGVSDKPAVFPPADHKASHAAGGADALTSLGPVSELHQDLGTVFGDVSIDLSAGLSVSAGVGGVTTLTFANVPAGGTATVLLRLTNGGAYAVTWGMAPRWGNGMAPVLSESGADYIAFYHAEGVWTGLLVASNVQ